MVKKEYLCIFSCFSTGMDSLGWHRFDVHQNRTLSPCLHKNNKHSHFSSGTHKISIPSILMRTDRYFIACADPFASDITRGRRQILASSMGLLGRALIFDDGCRRRVFFTYLNVPLGLGPVTSPGYIVTRTLGIRGGGRDRWFNNPANGNVEDIFQSVLACRLDKRRASVSREVSV